MPAKDWTEGAVNAAKSHDRDGGVVIFIPGGVVK
jgi:hypothetical protein